MFLFQTTTVPKSFSPLCAVNVEPSVLRFSSISPQNPSFYYTLGNRCVPSSVHCKGIRKHPPCFAVSSKSDSKPDPESSSKRKAKPGRRSNRLKAEESGKEDENPGRVFPAMIPRKPRRGRRSEAAAVEDFIRDSLERTFASIQQQNPEVLENKEDIMKDRVDNEINSEISDDDDEKEKEKENEDEDEDEDEVDDEDHERDVVGKRKGKKKKMVVEEENPNWPLDADVGWGIRASEYFEQHPIKNVVGEDGLEIDWEGEIDDNWVKEINCLEWESFAFHPSPLVVLVFERYNRATDNWKTLKELEKAAKVYWSAKDRLPPRTVKIDINIERDLAYSLKVKECPQILFLRGNKIFYREKEFRTSDELVQMIAHFYYNAKRPSCVNTDAQSPPY